jgi:hypothetical protein
MLYTSSKSNSNTTPLNTCNLFIECIYAKCVSLSPLLTYALIKIKPKDYNSSSKYAMNARDAMMQKLQEHSNQSEKML